MKANELRIGNWVNYCNGKRILDAELFLQLLKYTTPFDPIPLTEEWLLKFGFAKTENGWLALEICNDWSYLYWERLAGLELSVNKHQITMPHIKYVHQLQNLYFALTGVELTYEREKQ